MRSLLRTVAALFALAVTGPMAALSKCCGSEALFVAFGQALSLFPGVTGSYLRVGFYRQTLLHASVSSFIGFGSYFSHRRVRLADGVYIGAYCIIGMADLFPHATIASRVSILSGGRQHAFESGQDPIQNQGGVYKQVRIGRNCWIGEGSVVMADVGDGCVVGAGSVVTKHLGERLVLAGNPARILREASSA